MLRFFFILFLFIILLSCENDPPFIKDPIYNVLVYEEGGLGSSVTQCFLSVFFILYDYNGFEDIDYFELINVDNDIKWRVSQQDIQKVDYKDDKYYGYSFFEYNNGYEVLLGNYIIRVVDLAGNQVEMPLFVEINNKSRVFKPEPLNYNIKISDDRKNLLINDIKYNSVEIKFVNRPDLYNNTRRKFLYGEKININDGTQNMQNGLISIRLNSFDDDRLVYFLKLFNF